MKKFRIQQSASLESIPWGLIEPHEAQAVENHGQTLEELDDRWGLDVVEAFLVLNDKKLREIFSYRDKKEQCLKWLILKVSEYNARRRRIKEGDTE